jgi:hypothetical protein
VVVVGVAVMVCTVVETAATGVLFCVVDVPEAKSCALISIASVAPVASARRIPERCPELSFPLFAEFVLRFIVEPFPHKLISVVISIRR